ncbi:hypothetical protein DPX39_070071600 [Trypanosoma brucei equiperdum]|uniref:Uncharacterized protein n=1 Tax=Trypanosoma brucei equiperdum TaxID=630700 RepID=A0A3L6L7C3_9TRYP|nr:hypothetical protein DPX39_070071600 [Trypanosoma brucei equiperdum]
MPDVGDALKGLDNVVEAMRRAVSLMESSGAEDTTDVMLGAAELQASIHVLAREASASVVLTEYNRRGSSCC